MLVIDVDEAGEDFSPGQQRHQRARHVDGPPVDGGRNPEAEPAGLFGAGAVFIDVVLEMPAIRNRAPCRS